MGRPKGSKNKPKDGETPSVGHNTAELSDAEKQALLVRGLADLETMISDKDEIVAEIRTQRKRLISYGFEAFEIDFGLKLRKSGDGEALARRRREATIARFLNHPIGTQSDIFDEIDRTPSVDAAYEAGKVAGAEGKSANSPHPLGTEQNESWMKGWHEAQQTLASGFKKLETAEAAQAEAAEQDDLEVA
jgi:ribosome modulation factor